MNLRTVPLVLFFCILARAQQSIPEFVLNSDKPYVYLQFDHIGPRKPLRDGEGKVGLWLRIVNNCREPITIPTFNLPAGESGTGVFDEVIPDESTAGVTVEASGFNLPEEAGSKSIRPRPPPGYSAEVFSMTRVLPGKDLLFSVPLNHVSSQWFMRVRFVLDVGRPNVGIGPYTYLDFSKGQIPTGASTGYKN